MNNSSYVPSDTFRDPDSVAAEAAMHRAAKVADIRAEISNRRRHERTETMSGESAHPGEAS